MNKLSQTLCEIDGKPYSTYQRLNGITIDYDAYQVDLQHIQGSPGAAPASLAELAIPFDVLGLSGDMAEKPRLQVAVADWLLRQFNSAVDAHTTPNRGDEGSGSFQLLRPGQEILQRNVVDLGDEQVRLRFRISLPSKRKAVAGDEAEGMFLHELPQVVTALKMATCGRSSLIDHIHVVEDADHIAQQLEQHGLVAFVADGSILPRRSGVSDEPATSDHVVPFKSPDSMAIELHTPHRGTVRGMGIRSGITLIVGGGFHGKSTLLSALSKAVYRHVPGDGRELVVTRHDAMAVHAEDGRSVRSVDISSFITSLPNGANTERFTTDNASGSTSQAAAVVESVLSGSRLLVLDEDSSATNFMLRDAAMRELIPDDPIVPLVDHVRCLYERLGVSFVIVAGASAAYLSVADTVIAMRSYVPHDYTHRVATVDGDRTGVERILRPEDNRRFDPDNFDASYHAARFGKRLPSRIKPLRLKPKTLEYGCDQIELSNVHGLQDEGQVLAIGLLLAYARKHVDYGSVSPSQLAQQLYRIAEDEGLDAVSEADPLALITMPRPFDIAAAINRVRSLQIAQ